MLSALLQASADNAGNNGRRHRHGPGPDPELILIPVLVLGSSSSTSSQHRPHSVPDAVGRVGNVTGL